MTTLPGYSRFFDIQMRALIEENRLLKESNKLLRTEEQNILRNEYEKQKEVYY
jgi:hypothetical protein